MKLLEYQSAHTRLAKRKSDDEWEEQKKGGIQRNGQFSTSLQQYFVNNFFGNWQQAFKSAISSSEFLSKE